MTRPRTRNCLFFLLVFFLPVFLLVSCDDLTSPPPVDLSGKVLDLLTLGPVAGATVEFADGSRSTTTGEEGCDLNPPAASCGSWTLQGVPTPTAGDPDPLIRITAKKFAVSYNAFPLSLGILQYDLMVLSSGAFFVLPFLMTGGLLPADGCLVLGAVVGFVSTGYTQVVAQLAGAAINVVPNDLTVVYFGETGLPDPDLTATSALGLFGVVVPDATAVTSITLSGSRPGSLLAAPASNPVFPGSFVLGGLIDVNYTP